MNGHSIVTPTHIRLGRALGAAALATAALTACGGTSQAAAGAQNDHVASLVTATASGATAAGTAATRPPKQETVDSRRPQLRLDSSAEEITALRKAYAECLGEHGAWDAGTTGSAAQKAEDKARKACEDKEPLLPPEMDPERNPHYADAVRAEVKCLKGHGFKVHLVPAAGSDPNAISWTYDSIPAEGVDIEGIQDQCRIKAFGGGGALRPGPA
ncbi:hypothetical protein [Microbispora sp. ATCC PTA-5024]|uniref:hypothetical protein n=1 Tax=Microbispora sp. ATCC PTA-5024 TaxID=316330 RepID=UPI0003DC7528|nr:hypothetical protein [Microbispora sp. ATCC PTA-5024]ETK35123.1 hypothetical protein MPTA5024_15600 [Microbispora sp. ATCC PTA-5024]